MSTLAKERTKSRKGRRHAANDAWQVLAAKDEPTAAAATADAVESDDEAPEAISLSAGKQQAETAARQAQLAIDEQAAQLRKKRRAIDTRLKSQRKGRDERAQTVAQSELALPTELLDSVAEQDEQQKEQQRALAEEAAKKRANHTQFDSDDDMSDDELHHNDAASSSGAPMDWARGTRRTPGDVGRQKRARNEEVTVKRSGIQVSVLKATPKLSKPIDSSAVKFKKRCLYGKRVTRADALRHTAFRKLAVPLQFARR
ncbi:hypothetical protein SYNPS1DRAFT_28143 [Syncephalis pseudoplumigaleata]|uniref:Uncharacterized protein n=1 Tax=Syncephalis pseudoplumigaleata TaxID=1712513 RepID=A0A4P9Z1D9_9FUNG|nr:hypothetical protein SYNPS1DRAFT_28143 [Syncephalis pseudoplumigaleata]|eukprot:RKP26148.1 hypothetical protein SYNPS1DRAFT_28143 [Syncephalis pseudoplumigaleata]